MWRSSSAVMGTTLSGWGSAGVMATQELELGGSAWQGGQGRQGRGVEQGWVVVVVSARRTYHSRLHLQSQ
jgi:hypothetical protein